MRKTGKIYADNIHNKHALIRLMLMCDDNEMIFVDVKKLGLINIKLIKKMSITPRGMSIQEAYRNYSGNKFLVNRRNQKK